MKHWLKILGTVIICIKLCTNIVNTINEIHLTNDTLIKRTDGNISLGKILMKVEIINSHVKRPVQSTINFMN